MPCCLQMPPITSLKCRFALPALLPLITPDLHLSEQQGALLTAGYAVSAPSCAISSVPLRILHKSWSSQPSMHYGMQLFLYFMHVTWPSLHDLSPVFCLSTTLLCSTFVCLNMLHLRLGLLQLLYAAALIPIGLLADRVNRPRLLAGGLVMWSLLTMTGSKVSNLGSMHTHTAQMYSCASAWLG